MATCTRCPGSDQRCRRCGHGTCPDHLSLDRTCLACEVLYYESRDRLPLRAWFAVGFLLPWLVFASIVTTVELPARSGGVRAITTGFPVLDLALMTLVVAWFAGRAAVAARTWWHRRDLDRVALG